MRSDFSSQRALPAALGGLHVAIIMDGNGRWAAARRLPRTAGHQAGARAVRRTVEHAARIGVGTLTLYAFSSDNWRRPPREEFARALGDATHGGGAAPDVDLLIRTGGEQRLSDFLLWECAYAELWFTDRLWPDFTRGDLAAAVADFRRRDRRF